MALVFRNREVHRIHRRMYLSLRSLLVVTRNDKECQTKNTYVHILGFITPNVGRIHRRLNGQLIRTSFIDHTGGRWLMRPNKNQEYPKKYRKIHCGDGHVNCGAKVLQNEKHFTGHKTDTIPLNRMER